MAVLAIAWEESRADLRPELRGDGGLSIGRFQIRASTAVGLCPGLDITTYRGNVQCFLTMMRADLLHVGLVRAIIRHNGRAEGRRARAYADRVLTTIGRWSLEEATQ